MTTPKQTFAAIGIMVGMIIGSGVFALPYVVAQSGLWLGILAGLIALTLSWVMHTAYAEVVLRTPSHHRLPGYVTHYCGRFFGGVETFIMLMSFHAILLSYALLAGLFASQLWYGSAEAWTYIFYGTMAVLLLKPAKSIGEINIVLLIPFVLLVLGVGAYGAVMGNAVNLSVSGPSNFFLAFTTFLFALTGYSVVPDSLGVLGSKPAPRYARTLIGVASSVPFILYLPFIFGVLMLSGQYVSEDALHGLVPTLGVTITSVGAFVGLLAVATSYLSMGFDLKSMYQFDFKVSPAIAWVLVIFLPIIPYLTGQDDYIAILSFVGGALIAADGAFIMIALLLARRHYPKQSQLLRLGTAPILMLVIAFLSSVVFSIWRLIV